MTEYRTIDEYYRSQVDVFDDPGALDPLEDDERQQQDEEQE